MFTLKGRTMVITGGAGNNGLAMINAALENGMNVAFLSGFHSKAQAAIAKLDPKYKDQVIGFAQNPQACLKENMEAGRWIPPLRQQEADWKLSLMRWRRNLGREASRPTVS